MSEQIFLGVAWPYANGTLHTGQLVGAYLPADIFARFHRLKGNAVLMVSGSDMHGTPITVRAEQEGTTPQAVAERFHSEFLATWERVGISWDLYTTTSTENHREVVQDIFLKLYERGDIYTDTMPLPYCTVEERFLLDRYVEGTCPICGDPNARGDQCDNCGNVLDPSDLKDRRCKFDGSEPEIRDSEHFFLRLSAYNERLKQWLSTGKEHWRKNVLNFSLGVVEQGLLDRAITRDMEWGIPVPIKGWESKRIYVWFENVIGYLSAAIEWAKRKGEPDAWRAWWQDPNAKTYYFVGKDNIWFHTLNWPMELMGYSAATGEHYNLPYDVPANQYQTVKGSKASTSRRMAIWVPEFLDEYDPDALRYYLSATMPETSDSDFTWADFVRRNNDELVATWGNLVNRALTLTYRNFDGRVPEVESVDPEGDVLLGRIERALEEAGEQLAACRFRGGLSAAMSAAQETNKFLDDTAPWKALPDDRDSAARSLYTVLCAINGLKVAFAPYLPFSSQRLHELLGFDGALEDGGWRVERVPAGQPLGEPAPLFKKLDPKVVEAEEERLAS
jgi:methionyl-tRNA synthetase